ncbi:MAG: hypothetical protein HRU70_07690 [Phycisphaeraceae bacterium]|nr:MAG: hypothetical protein HRU70_07690 [Phycisphaeraceae bacterium]
MFKTMTTASLAALALAAAMPHDAFAGPDYQAYKRCLANCIRTTPRWSWARAACGADCVADYLDSKISFDARVLPDSSAYVSVHGIDALDWRTPDPRLVVLRINRTPLNLPIEMITLHLMNDNAPPEIGGMIVGQVPGGGQRNGTFALNLPPFPTEGVSTLVAEIRYADVDDVDDVISIAVIGMGTDLPCPADFNGDGFLDFFDLDAFVSCFDGGDCPDGRTADYNADGFVDFFDLDAYVTDFEAGC